MWSLKWRGKQEHVVGFTFFFFEAEFPEWGSLIARHSVIGGSSEGQLKSCFLQDRRCSVWNVEGVVCLDAASPAQCMIGKGREGRGARLPARPGLGSESSSRPLPAPARISECAGSPGLSGLCLPHCGVPVGLTGDKGCVTSEAFNPCDSVRPRGGSLSEHVLSCGGKAGTQKATCCLSLYPVGPLPVHPGGPGAQE